jgi:hypothetical protein
MVCVPPSWAQTSTGQLNITVLDASGAVIPSATVTISGTDTGNVVRTLKTNDVGVANAPLLRPSVYTITVNVQGFKELVRKGVILRVGDVLELPLTLETGSTTQQITVVGQTPLLEQNSGTLAQVVPETMLNQLPLNGRDYLSLGNLLPGSVPSQGSRDATFDMYGNSGIQNAFILDGARNESYVRGLDLGVAPVPFLGVRDAYRPPVDAISEFAVNASNYSSEYGAAAGAVISVVTKSGTNQVHGSVYEFYQSNYLNARNFFTPATNAPVFVFNQFGGSLGGPIKKNKAWIFGAYEGVGQGGGSTSISTVPTAAMHTGNFTGLNQLYDPFTTVANPSGSGYVRTAYTNNIITPSEISATGQQLVNWYPMPNIPGTTTANNYAYNVATDYYHSNAIFRGDYQVSDKVSMFARFSLTQDTENQDASLPPPAASPGFRHAPARGVGYGYTHAISTNLVNEFRFSWTRITVHADQTNPLNPVVPGSLDPKIDAGTAVFNVTGVSGLGGTTGCCGNDPLVKSSAVWELADNVSKSKGKHLLKFGADILYIRPSTFAPNVARGSFTFSGTFTNNPQHTSGTGSAVADLLLGTANQATAGNFNQVVERGHYYGGYVQDDWKISRNLTLNLGVRYEVFPPYIEAHNALANFIVGSSNPYFGQYVFAGDSRFPRGLMTTDYNNVAPRVGFAYHVPQSKDLVIRGAFGMFYGQDEGQGINNKMTNNPPFYNYGGVNIISDGIHPATGFELVPGATITRGTPVSPSQFTLNPASTTQLNDFPSEYTTPYVSEWNLTIEKQLPWNMLWQANYVGNNSIDIWGISFWNEPLTYNTTSPNARRPLAQYSAAPVRTSGPWDRSHYEGLSTELRKRFSNGVFFFWNLTWSNTLNLANPAEDLCNGTGCYIGIQNVYNLNSLMGHSDDDIPLRMVFSGTWGLPFGKGHALAKEGVGAALAGGWQVEGVYTLSNGHPFTPVWNTDTANVDGTTWPDRVCNGELGAWTLQNYFDTACFPNPSTITPPTVGGPPPFGNTGRNILYGPVINNIDFALHRSFALPIHENTNLELRAEAFNVFNHPEFSTPATTLNTTTTGTISGTSINNRIVQVAAKITW